MKLTYHKDNNWEDKFIAKTQKSVSDLYESQYAAPVVTDDENNDNKDSDDNLFSHIYKKR